ncbi:hypothetical protein CCAX7_66080 [Capsulimonas corticalis]|uniref:non-reducing end alpha-L-arabinofuranosidase n=1 Tax=Capsulimonas corticalis TaxID=2219043 RepID=A0A402CRH9_9BACT|nr:alpha-L-arabinofuranosidase C-terminal domain-containing protein [Capsulimonas corticalis]BDI34557.1 hypothetical protein CCAX7_66080 [Capsulimonas corticalis]
MMTFTQNFARRNARLRSAGLMTMALASALPMFAADAQAPARITVNVDRTGARISPMLYGIFYEEIEHAGDGGLYAEMLENRSFEEFRNGFGYDIRLNQGILPRLDDPNNIPAWELRGDGTMALDQSQPLNGGNPTALKISLSGGAATLVNAGFAPARHAPEQRLGAGLSVRKSASYKISLYGRGGDGFMGPISVTLVSHDGKTLARGEVANIGPAWAKSEVTLTATGSDPTARLDLGFTGKGTVWLDMVSLFPADTFLGRPNGLRKDMAQMIADLKPSFVRFPGGCFVEGLYQVKEAWRPLRTLGDVAQRPGIPGARWQYGSTDGFGYHEMLQMCEDIHAEPLLVLNCGMTHGDSAGIRFDDGPFPPLLKEALDSIEYANGPADSEWGKARAANGHPEPFHLKYIEIGNEDGEMADYAPRYKIFQEKIHAKYPDIHLIVGSTRNPEGVPKDSPVEIVDEHYYETAGRFIDRFHKYDAYDRKAPKVYIGEFAVTDDKAFSTDKGFNNLRAALGEAVYMLGFERNSDVVAMASYAPLFCRIDQKMWPSNLIYFDQQKAFGTPSYYVWKTLSENRGDINLAVDATSPPATMDTTREHPEDNDKPFPQSLYVGATREETSGDVLLKVVNILNSPQDTSIALPGAAKIAKQAEAVTVARPDVAAANDLTSPVAVAPAATKIANAGKDFHYTFPANSVTIIRLHTQTRTAKGDAQRPVRHLP